MTAMAERLGLPYVFSNISPTTYGRAPAPARAESAGEAATEMGQARSGRSGIIRSVHHGLRQRIVMFRHSQLSWAATVAAMLRPKRRSKG